MSLNDVPFSRRELDELIEQKDVLGLIDTLEHPKLQKSHSLRSRVVHELGAIGDVRAVQPVSNILLTDPHGATRGLAAIALGQIGDRGALPALREALTDDSKATRMWAMRSLGYLKDRQSVDPLVKSLSENDGGVREFAAQALGDIGDQRATPPLIALLDDQRGTIKRAAAAALARLGDSRAIDPLQKAHKKARFLTRKSIRVSLQELEQRFGSQ